MNHSLPSHKAPRSRPPSLLACVSCRKQHLKCDSRMPLCTRCSTKNLECIWVESRRGYRDYHGETCSKTSRTPGEKVPPSQRVQNVSVHVNEPNSAFTGELYTLDAGVAAGQSYTYDEMFQPILDETLSFTASMPATMAASPTTMPSSSSSASPVSYEMAGVIGGRHNQQQRDGSPDLMTVYYKYFHPAHPFIAPWKLVKEKPSLLPEPLKAVMRFVAKHYVSQPGETVPEQITSASFSNRMPDDGFKVQALLLYCIACFASSEQMQGAMALENAIEIALRIGMNRQTYASTHAPSDPTLEESWWRTWWTLFIMDGLATAIGGGAKSFTLHGVFCDVPLPGEDDRYANLSVSARPASLTNFRDRIILEDTTVYSSMAYCVEAMSIMGAIFTLNSDTFATTDPQVEAADASISNFLLSLPSTKREVSELDGRVDETLLMAHMLINWSSILLHRPRSTLTFIRNHYATVCTKREAASMPALAYASHTSKTLRAANAIMSLASIQRPLSFCTPCLMCGIAVAAVVHIPAYAIAENSSQAVAIKERLQLGISALGRFSEMWSRAAIAKSQIAAFAREVLTTPNVSVDSSGTGMPVARSGTQIEDITFLTDEGLLEYDLSMDASEQWAQVMVGRDF